MIPPETATAPHVKSGKLRALAVTAPTVRALPRVAHVAAVGSPDILLSRPAFLPAKTPPGSSSAEPGVVRFLHSAEAKQKFLNVESRPSAFAEGGRR